MITVAEVNDLQTAASLRHLWDDLWRRSACPSFTMRWDWLHAYWQRHRNQRPRILVVSLAGRPLGIVPLVVKLVPSGIGLVRALTYPADSWSAFFGPLGPHPAACLSAAMRHLAETRRDWDLIDLRYVDTEVSDAGRTWNALRRAGFHVHCRPWFETPVLRLDGQDGPPRATELSSRASADVLPEATLAKAADAEKRLSRLGAVRWERWRPNGVQEGDTARRWPLFEQGVRLSLQAELGRLPCCRTALLQDVHPMAVDAAMADLCFLWAGDRLVAWSYGFVHEGRLELIHVAGGGALAREAVLALTARLVEDSRQRGDVEVVWGPLCAQVGMSWSNATRPSYRYTHFARLGLCGPVLHLGYHVRGWFGRADRTARPRFRGRAGMAGGRVRPEPAEVAADGQPAVGLGAVAGLKVYHDR